MGMCKSESFFLKSSHALSDSITLYEYLPPISYSSIVVVESVNSLIWDPSPFLTTILRPVFENIFLSRIFEKYGLENVCTNGFQVISQKLTYTRM